MTKLSVDDALKEIKNITCIPNPNDYPAVDDCVYIREWTYTDMPSMILWTLSEIYGKHRLSIGYSYSGGDTYLDFSTSSAMRFKAVEITNFLKQHGKRGAEHVLWADVQIQKNRIQTFDLKLEQILGNFANRQSDQETIIQAINDIKNYDILAALTYTSRYTEWSGQLNPWKNLEFLQNGASTYNKKDEPTGGLGDAAVKKHVLMKLKKQADHIDKQTEQEIQDALARNRKEKKKLGLDADSIHSTADKEVDEYHRMIKKAKQIIDTKNDTIAKRFAYHYLFKNK